MAGVLTLLTERKYTGEEVEVDLSGFGLRSNVLSPASGILEDSLLGYPDPLPHIDLNLRLIIAACMATEPQDRPSLSQLSTWVYTYVSRTDAEYYNYNPGGTYFESDENIRSIIQRFVLDAA